MVPRTDSTSPLIRKDEHRVIALRRALEAQGIKVHNTSGLRNHGCRWHNHGCIFTAERVGVGLPLTLTVVRSTLLGDPINGEVMSADDIISLSDKIAEAIDGLLPSS